MKACEKIRMYRKRKGFTQKQLGNKLNVSAAAISQFEKQENIQIETIKKIADALEVPYIELIDDARDEEKAWFHFKFDAISESEKIKYFSKKDINNYINKKEEFPKEWIDRYTQLKEARLIDAFKILNEKGQEKAIDQVEMLTKIEEYKK